MKKKLLLITLLVALFACIFVVSVSAETTKSGTVIPDWTDVITYETGDKAIPYKAGFDTEARVLLANGDNTYSTYPSNYIIKGTDAVFTVSSELDFTALNAATGKSYSYASVIRFEMPVGYTSVEDRAFKNDRKFTALQTVKVCEGVTTMGINIFYESSTVVEVELPSTLETIGTEFAYKATALEKINIPQNLTEITTKAFCGCSKLTTVDFSKATNLETIGYWSFYNCSSLESAILPEGLTYIDELAFKLTGVKEVYLPSTLETVSTNNVFAECSKLETITSKATFIAENMFYNATALKTVTLEGTVTIGTKAFQCDSASTTGEAVVFLPETLTTINDYAFKQSPVKTVYLPSSLTTIGTDVFYACCSLENINCKSEILGTNMFKDCTALESVDLSSVVTVGDSAFYITSNSATSKLKSVTFSDKLQTIEDYAFIRSAITSLEIPSSLTTVGTGVFKENKSLTSVIFLGTKMGASMFQKCSSLSKLVITTDFVEYGSSALNDVSTTFATFYTGTDYSRIKSLCAVSRITQAKYSTYESYKDGTHATGSYIFIYGANLCDVAYGEHNIPSPTYYFTSYTEASSVKGVCTRCGIENVEEKVNPLFTCLGFSSPDDSFAGISIGFRVDHEAVSAYERITNSTVSYGLFVGVYEKLGNDDVLNLETGDIANGTVVADLSEGGYVLLKLKIGGFTTDTQKASNFTVGTYVINGDKISYVQAEKPTEGQKYYYTSYNNIVK